MRRSVPKPAEVANLLGDLLGKPVTSTPSKGEAEGKRGAVAKFNDPDGKPIALLFCELPLAAAIGVALQMLPAERVEENLKADTLDESVLENFREVCNIASTLFSTEDSAASLGDVRVLETAPDFVSAPKLQGRRLETRMSVEGYDGGVLSVVVA